MTKVQMEEKMLRMKTMNEMLIMHFKIIRWHAIQ